MPTSPHDMADSSPAAMPPSVNLFRRPHKLCLGSHPGEYSGHYCGEALGITVLRCTPQWLHATAAGSDSLRLFPSPTKMTRARAVGLLSSSPLVGRLYMSVSDSCTPLSPFRFIHTSLGERGYCNHVYYCPATLGLPLLHSSPLRLYNIGLRPYCLGLRICDLVLLGLLHHHYVTLVVPNIASRVDRHVSYAQPLCKL
jgi:hypothetical protein